MLKNTFYRYSNRLQSQLIFLGIMIVLSCILTSPGFALTVSLNWSASPDKDISGYSISYGIEPNNYDQSLEIDVGNHTEGTIGSLNDNTTYYIAVRAYDYSGQFSDYSNEVEVMGQETPDPVTVMAVNFQPSNAPVPENYVMDSGQRFDETLGYGWTTPPASYGPRDRNNSLSPDQSYDTMIHVEPTGVWELAVSNGTYIVTVCMGDPSYPTGTQNVQVEGLSVIENEHLSSSVRWIENDITVDVTDGLLTLTFEGSNSLARLCWVSISSDSGE